MSKKLALALIVAGTISAIFCGWNYYRATNIYQRIQNEQQYSHLAHPLDIKGELEIAKDPRVKINSAYGGGSFALALASAGVAVTRAGLGLYSLIKKRRI